MTPFLEYLREDQLPNDPDEAQKVIREALKYTLVGQHLFRRGFAFPLLRRVEGEEAAYIIREVHEGICGMHIGGRALAIVDYFTKWVEAESITTISSKRIKHFFRKKIICRFGIPAEIVLDNGTQFASKGTVEFCEGLKIKQIFTLVKHRQSNSQAEAANKVILRGLRRRLEEAKGRWADELPQVLWSYHPTPHSTTNKTPFCLTFGTEAMIPVEIREPSPRTALFEPGKNEEELRANLDMLQEVWEIAHVREYAIKARAARKYDRGVIPRHFMPKDLVLRRITQKVEANKLTPAWEGPFRIFEEAGQGVYRLEQLDGKKVPCTWNAASL
ncbi:Tf2-8, partial [Mucuna pruriens]